ncbi:glycosyltransferase family 87 protein [Haloarcula salinisoli]|uniref:DUF2029 domain-containing protein n=1 Tax=Haloarcula salinisoli TaxID=2487746 RepID=A0A8J8C978_9EURY|nr:glycosyltransferase family 87 protein [Halomicroarcula salinisoli]MBX0287374.1 DUF2029 domain-containing protein [Halomicroarcula salinisoli]MBX0305052.1 DUF2029 domain-containing protein [Halomicroarcula salinisoli]
MLSEIENIFARLGFYSLLLGLVVGIGILIPTIGISPIWMISAFVIGFVFLISSYGIFRLQISSTESREDILWCILLSPIVLYIPLNLILMYVGLVQQPRLQDFGAYYNGAVRFLNGAPLYQTTQEIPSIQAEISGDMPYLYPPIFILLFVPFTVLPATAAGLVWDILVLVFLVWSVSKLVSTFTVNITDSSRVLLYLSVISFAPTITWIKAGQVSGLLTGLLCLSGAALRTKRDGQSGMLTTLGSAIKPFYATSGAHLLRSRKRLFSSLWTGLFVLLFGLLIFGLESHVEYLNILIGGKGWESTTLEPNKWNAGHFNPFFLLGSLKHLPRIILVFITIGLALHSNESKIPIEYIFALGVAIVPIAGPTTNTLALSTAIPAIVMVGFYEMENDGDFPKLLIVSALLIHIHPYTIEFVSKFGPRIYPEIERITPIIPLLQPALYGMALLIGYIISQSWENASGVSLVGWIRRGF